MSKFGITENEYKYEHNIFYLYASPFIGIFKIIYNYILSRFRNINKQTFIINKGIKQWK